MKLDRRLPTERVGFEVFPSDTLAVAECLPATAILPAPARSQVQRAALPPKATSPRPCVKGRGRTWCSREIKVQNAYKSNAYVIHICGSVISRSLCPFPMLSTFLQRILKAQANT